jgi:endoglucanase
MKKNGLFQLSLFFFLFFVSFRTNAAPYNYAEVLQKSMWFYEAQRSGELPADNRVEWRGASAIKDGSDVGVDLSGGWYDAGDNMKFNFPMAFSVTMLAWGGLEYYEGYKNCDQWGWLLNNVKWAADYFIKCHSAPNEFYGQIGLGMTDHKWWGAPEVFPNARPASKIDAAHPGSDLAAEAAAALASSSLLFRGTDPAYADLLVKHARELYAFADASRGLYSDAITDVTDFYKSWSGYQDELVWGAIWLYLATEDATYLTKAEAEYDKMGTEPQSTIPRYKDALSWDDKAYGCYVLLAKITNKAKYHTDAQRWLDWWTYGYTARKTGVTTWNIDKGIAYTPSGLAWVRQWGPLRYAANTGFAAFVYSDCAGLAPDKKQLYAAWAKSQIDFALGDNEQKRSYVCGFGSNPPVKPHHRGMHGPYLDDNGRTPEKSRHILFGGLVGGPGVDGSYVDDRLDAVKNEVATDYNAGFSSALARLVRDEGGTTLADFPQPQPRDTEYCMVAKINTTGSRFSEISATVQNKTTWPARYSKNLSLKYFLDLSEITKAGIPLTDIKIELKGVTTSNGGITISGLKQYGSSGTVYFVEVSFAGESIYPGGQSAYRRETQFRIGLPETAAQDLWDPSNDPSFTGLTTMADPVGHPNIPIYENGTLVWGKEPDGTHFVPSAWNKPTLTTPKYNAPVWKTTLFNGVAVVSVFQPETRGLFTIIPRQKQVAIIAETPIEVRCLSPSGRLLLYKKLCKGNRFNLTKKSVCAGVFILQVTGASFKEKKEILMDLF